MKDIEYVIIKIEGNQLFLNDNNSVLAKNAIKIDDFILPEKWCIKRTPENWNIIVDYLNKTYNRTYTYHNPSFPWVSNHNTMNDSKQVKHSNLPEITFEQFKKYVLNEKV